MHLFFTKRNIGVALCALLLLSMLGYAVYRLALYRAPVVVVAPTLAYAREEVIGTSTLGRAITAHTFGTGDTEILFVGGMHGGYEWNSVLLAYEFIDFFATHPESIGSSQRITIIPALNPDGVFAVTGHEGRFAPSDVASDLQLQKEGRFTASGIDLNRNFDCKWQATSTWQGRTVSAGTAPFSEPESLALRDYVLARTPVAVVFWHSAANAVYASECTAGILPETLALMNAYASGAGYPAVSTFDAYPVTGDAEGWLASVGIPAITVELSSHETLEWEKNLLGVQAIISTLLQK